MSFGPPSSAYTQSALSSDDRRKNRRRRTALVVAGAAVALAVLVGGGVWLFRDGDSGSVPADRQAAAQDRLDVRETVEERPASVAGQMAFRFSADDLSPGERYEMPGMWATDKILAKGINRTLVGFALGTDAAVGDEQWNLRLAGPVCGVTKRVSVENRTAVLFRSGEDDDALCDRLAFVDLDTGKKLWQAEMPVPGSEDSASQDLPAVTLTHATVAVTWGDGADAYDMDSGERLWRVKAADSCAYVGAGGGRALLTRIRCYNGDAVSGSNSETTYQVRKLDPRTGKTRWTYEVARNTRGVALVSAEPAVIGISAGDAEITELISLDGQGGHRATIGLKSGRYLGECTEDTDRYTVEDCPTIAVGDDQVFLRSKETDATGDKQEGAAHVSNWIVGFDLATGNTVKKFESGPDQVLYPLRMSGDRLLALRESNDHISPNGLVSLDPATGEETPYLYFDLPVEGYELTAVEDNDIVVEDGRLFFGRRAATGPTDGSQKAWQWLVLGVGSTG
ncbi:PQQ-binding-like beta-propeller repeat protein [Streptomyces sp. NPDC059785]|uniref:outer membrane protein assembly factor BamB family protein n=1 Tax=unclassified Streptomyces TaxID=2593676 RepID=UPI0036558EAB